MPVEYAGMGGRVLAYWRMLHPLPSIMTVVASGAFVLLAARGLPALGTLGLLLVIEACRQFSISAFNDYFDRDMDRGRVEKPVAAGVISARVALVVGALLGVVAVLQSLPFGWGLTLLTVVGLGGGLLYDAGLKYTAFSWLPFSIAFPTLPLWAWVGVHPGEDLPGQLLWVVPVAAVLALGIHLADTIPDLEHDSAAGALGLAHRLGLERSVLVCWAAFGAAIGLTLMLWAVLPYRLEWYLPGVSVALILWAAGIVLYRVKRSHLKVMALLAEMSALALAVGWVGAVV